LNSIKREIPLHRLILVDRFSEDDTVLVVKKVFPNAIVKQTDANLGVARKYGFDLVDTEFFAWIDDDIELCDGWFKKVIKHVDSATGAVQATALPAISYSLKWFNWVNERRKSFIEQISVSSAENPDSMRGMGGYTLIRTCAVKDWNPPKLLCAYENHFLLRHIVKMGYAWKAVRNVTVEHHHGKSPFIIGLRKARWNMAGARLIKYDDLSLWFLVKAMLKQVIYALYASLKIKEPRFLVFVSMCQLAFIQGWTGWTKYLLMKR